MPPQGRRYYLVPIADTKIEALFESESGAAADVNISIDVFGAIIENSPEVEDACVRTNVEVKSATGPERPRAENILFPRIVPLI